MLPEAQAATAIDDRLARRVTGDEIRIAVKRIWGGVATLAVTNGFISLTFQPIAAPIPFAVWLVAQWGIIALLAAASIAFHYTTPDDDRIADFWIPVGNWLMLALNFVVAASIWMLLPGAPEDLIHVMILLYCWFVFVQVAGDTGTGKFSAIAMASVLLSLAAFVIAEQMPYRFVMAAFFALFAATVVGLRTVMRSAVLEALRARTAAQNATAALEVALAEVAAERDAKSRFIAAASHDLQQPIQAAHLYFVQMARVEQPRLRAEIEQAGKAAFGAAQSLVTAMLDHLRLGAHAVTPRSEAIALPDFLARIAAEAALAAENPIDVRVACVVRHLQTDRALLARALGNLAQNAVRHSGGTRVLIVARCRSGMVEFHVIDNGRGVPDAHADSVFEEFAQGPVGGRAGFGIGLASARAAMRVQGGDIRLDPRWRHGAAFSIFLPVVASEQGAEPLCAAA